MSEDTMDRLLEVLMVTPTEDGWGAAALFWGPPGIGKTKRLRMFARRHGLALMVLSPGLMGEGAFGVTPVPRGQGDAMRIAMPPADWVDRFEDDAGEPVPGIVLVDELTTAPPALQPPLLGLIQEKMIGNHYLGGHVRVIGAANPVAQAAAGWDLPLPLANRMGHFDWPAPAIDAWTDHMLGRAMPRVLQGALGEKHAEPEVRSITQLEQRVAHGWSKAYAVTAGQVTTFINRAGRDKLLKIPAESDPQASRTFPTPRTQDLAIAALTTATILGCDEAMLDDIYRGFVGHGVAVEFAVFRATMDLPDPEQLLDHNAVWKHEADRLDRSMAVLSACAAMVVGTQDREKALKRADRFWQMLGSLPANATDVGIPAGRLIARAANKELATRVKSATAVLARLRPMLEAAGVQL
jgi:hypothetical protein